MVGQRVDWMAGMLVDWMVGGLVDWRVALKVVMKADSLGKQTVDSTAAK